MLASYRKPSLLVTQLVPARPSPIYINEVLGHIFSFLTQSVLRQAACLVCRQWLLVAKTHFRHHLHVDHGRSKSWKNLEERLLTSDELSVGRTISPVMLVLDSKEMVLWTKAMELVTKTLSEIDRHPTRGQLRIVKLNLSLEHWWKDKERFLVSFNPSRLKELSLDLPYHAGPFPVGSILAQCPNLRSLSVSANKRAVEGDIIGEVHHASVQIDSLQAMGGAVLSLQHLSFHNMCMTTTELLKLVPKLLQLVELRLLSVRPWMGGNFENDFNNEQTAHFFWLSVSQHCPSLETIAYSVCPSRDLKIQVPVELFPQVSSWGIDSGHTPVRSALRSLTVHAVENRLTRLEIIGGSDHIQTSNHLRDELLNQLLCCSPHLLHLSADQLQFTSAILWDRKHYVTLWNCRQLRTLAIKLENRWNVMHEFHPLSSRHVFGYLSRVCPMLLELSLTIDCQVLALKNGLCLLTRLKHLERLTIHVENSISYYLDEVRIEDFAWFQQYSSKSPEKQSSSSLSSLVPSFFSRTSVSGSSLRKGPRANSFEESCSLCIDAVWKEATHDEVSGIAFSGGRLTWMEKRRSKIQQQQRENSYCTDFGWEVPMVDGVKDFMVYGTLLDIEARLQAHLFQQNKERDHRSQQHRQAGLESLPTQISSTQPWPNMGRISLTYDGCFGHHGKVVRKHTKLGVQIMKQLRPDIVISCAFP